MGRRTLPAAMPIIEGTSSHWRIAERPWPQMLRRCENSALTDADCGFVPGDAETHSEDYLKKLSRQPLRDGYGRARISDIENHSKVKSIS